MIHVVAKPLRSYFSRPAAVQVEHVAFPAFYSFRHWLNPLVIFTGVTVLFLLGGVVSRTSFLIGLTLVVCGVYLFYSARAAARALNLVRQPVHPRLVEGDEVQVIVEVRNRGGFPLFGLVIDETFTASLKSRVRLALARAIPPHSHMRLQYTRKCDGGMGKHEIGPLEAVVTDPLGIFKFLVIEDSLVEVDVLPRIESLPELSFRGSPHSALYGFYDVAQRGFSVNFSGIRPYSPGDSLRHIAWKLTARTGELMVKEFERAVNSEVTVVLDLNPDIHLGIKSLSTWEYARDAALSIMSRQLELNNSVRLVSNHTFSELGRGEDHFHYLCREILKWSPEQLANDPSLMRWGVGGDLLLRTSNLISRSSTLVYLAPYNKGPFDSALRVLKHMTGEGIDIHVVLIDVNSFVSPLVRKLNWAHLAEVGACRGIEEELANLRRMGFHAYQLQCSQNLAKGFLVHG